MRGIDTNNEKRIIIVNENFPFFELSEKEILNIPVIFMATTRHPIRKTRLKKPNDYYVMQSTDNRSKPNLRKALPALIEARGRGGP